MTNTSDGKFECFNIYLYVKRVCSVLTTLVTLFSPSLFSFVCFSFRFSLSLFQLFFHSFFLLLLFWTCNAISTFLVDLKNKTQKNKEERKRASKQKYIHK